MRDYKINKLINGLEYLTIHRPESLSFSLTVGIKVGSRHETDKVNGISHLLEHMLYKGNRLFKTKYDLYNELDRMGAVYNAYTDKNKTVFFIKAHNKHQKRLIEIFSSLICEPSIDNDDLENEKKIVMEEIKNTMDDPTNKIYNKFFGMMYDNKEPIVKTISGTVAHIASITRDDVITHLDTFYTAQNMVVSIVGNLDEDVNKYMEESSFVKAPQGNKTQTPDIIKPTNKTIINFINKPTKQMLIGIAFPTRGLYDSRLYDEEFINMLLSGGMSSRLFGRLREEEGLVYSINTMIANFEEAGLYLILTAFDPENYKKVIDNIFDELIELQTKLINMKEYDKIRTSIIGKSVLEIEDNADVGDYYVNQMLFFRDNITSLDMLINEYENVSIKNVKETAKWLFNWKRMKIVIFGNFSKNGKEKVNNILSIIKTRYQNKNTE